MMKPSPPSWEHQTRAGTFIEDKPGAMLAMEMGTGKDLDDDTPIATTEGWTRMGDIQTGQQVFDERGQPCTVTGVYPQGERDVYDVAFDDGAIIRAGREHLWATLTHSQRARIHKGRKDRGSWATQMLPITTEGIRNSLVHQRGTLVESMHSIPVAAALELPEAALPIDPYILGLWLGDGTSAESAITCHEDDEPHYAAAVIAAGENWRQRNRVGSNLTCTMAGGDAPVIVTRLKSLGVLGNKQIPQRYLRAGREQRTKLLQGLIDSDGYVDPRNGNVEFTSTSRKLAEGTLELAISLGQKATMHQGEATLNGEYVSEKWRVIFAPTTQAASLPRKLGRMLPFIEERNRTTLARTGQRYIRSVEPAGRAKTTCITVDSPSMLFLAGRQMVPTHNTKVAINHMESTQANLILVLAPLSVVDHVWPREIQRHGSRENLTIIPLGTKAGAVRQKATKAAEGLRLATARKGPAVVIVNYESAWREPLCSLLKGIHWDLFVMDECHPAGTPIATPDGHKEIQSLREGDPVWGVDHLSGEVVPTRVTHTFSRRNHEAIIRVGKTPMTPEHPVWTDRGYIPAMNVRDDDRVCRLSEGEGDGRTHPDLRMVPVPVLSLHRGEEILRETVHWESTEPTRGEESHVSQEEKIPSSVPAVLGTLHGGQPRTAVLQPELRDPGQEPGAHAQHAGTPRRPGEAQDPPGVRIEPLEGPGEPGEISPGQPGERIPTTQRGERNRTNGTPADPSRLAGMADGIRGGNGTEGPGNTNTLQDRPGEPGAEDRHRGRRAIPQGQEDQRKRPEEGLLPSTTVAEMW